MSLGAARAALAARLAAGGIDSAALDARLLLCAAAEVSHSRLVADAGAVLPPDAAARLEDFAARRLAGEPVSRILGRRGFWTLDLTLTPDVLDPRPETELLVETALELLPTGVSADVLDLGTGSGAILAAVLVERPAARGLGLDRSEAAARVAGGNFRALGLGGRASVAVGDWGRAIGARFDLVVSNPPYVVSDAIAGLAREARHDPPAALDGGPDGLAAYRALALAAPNLLKAGGRLIVEIGSGQAGDVAALFAAAGLRAEPARRDLAGIERALVAGL